MKKLLLTLLALCTFGMAQSQVQQLWCENFDGATVNATSTGVPGWSLDVNYSVSAPNSYRGQYQAGGGPVYLTSPVFSTVGLNFVTLTFDQICKIEFTDAARLEYSIDGGATWNTVTDNPPLTDYQGTGVFAANGNSFTEGSYLDWAPGTTTAPTSAWWKNETFDLSGALGNQATVRIRFVLTDVINGLGGRYGWLLDNICVVGAPCELIPPTASAPYPGNPLWQGTVFNLGPFDLNVSINDQSGIQNGFADLFYTVNGGPVQQTILFNLFDSLYLGQIPAANDGDTICWWFEAYDASGCNNMVRYPAVGEICFYPVSGISFPFCDNFEIQNNLWSASTGSPTDWTYGNPTGPALNTANSPSNVWGVGEVAGAPGYSNNVTSYLNSPVFDFSSTSVANLSFWQNRQLETNWDGVRLEFSTDGGTTWTIIGGGSTANPDPNGTNWYTDDNIVSSTLPGWEGPGFAGPTGWLQSKYKLGTVPGLGGQVSVQFRFVFTTDASVVYNGFHIDDFCITVPCNADIGVSSFVSPLPGSGQPGGSASTITVNLENFGQQGQSNFNIGYSINGVVQTPVAYTANLAPGQTAQATLPTYTVPNNAYTLCVWTELAGDCVGFNDTVCANFVGIPTLIPSPSYCDDFESGNVGWSNQLGPNGNAGTIWELGLPAFGATSGANSGTNAWDVNLNAAYTNNANCQLYTPYFDFAAIGAARMQFALNYNAENFWDGTRLEYSTNGGTTWSIVGGGSITNPDPCGTNWYTDDQLNSSQQPAWAGNSGGWKTSTYKLCCTSGIFFNATPVQFRFVFTSDGSVITDGFSIDDFCIYAAQGDDIGITAITQPVGGAPVGNSQTVVVTLENFGATTITSTPITYTVNGQNPVTITWTGSLPPCGQATVVLPSFVVSQGVNQICAWTSLASDLQPANDTTCASVIGQPIITPTYLSNYNDNFDQGNIGWAPYVTPGAPATTIWEFGTPNFGATTGAYTAPNCWDVNLTTGVTGNANTYVTTPFFDFTNAQAAILRFWQNRSMNAFGDKFFIEYAVNGGPWTLLQPTTQLVTNWYNNNDSWDDNTGLWIQSIFKDVYSAVGGSGIVQFRFVYTSVNFTNSEGVSFDNFEIFVPIPLSVTTLAVNTSVPNQLIFPGQPITFAAPINNNGINTVFNHNVTLVIDGGIVSSDPVIYVPNGLLPDSTKTHNFNNTWIAVPGFHQVCVYTDSPNGSTDLNQFDDTSCVTVLVFDSVTTSQLPYCTSFETGNQWVTANAISYRNASSWEIGTPVKPTLNGARTGSNAWTTKLTGNYDDKDSSGLFSSLFRVEAGNCYKISFHQRYRMEYGSDGGAVDYSTDYGVTWNRLDFAGTPNVVLYGASPNYTYVSELDPSSPSLKGFTGVRNSWQYNEKTFRPGVDAQLIVRWRFASDFSANDEGWSIDDICFEDLGSCTPLGIDDFAVNDFGISQNFPNPADESTTLEYMIPAMGQVRIILTDIVGQVVAVLADDNMAAGKHTVQISTSTLAPGMYHYTFIYEGQQVTKRMIVAH